MTSPPPPPYTTASRRDRKQLTALRATVDSVVTRELSTTQRAGFNSGDTFDPAQQLRRALQHLICVNYGVEMQGDTGWYDCQQFLGVAGRIKDLHNLPESTPESVRMVHAVAIKNEVQGPATQLGLPSDVAIAMLVRYSLYLTPEMRYTGCHQALFERPETGYRDLVEKVVMDKHVTLCAVVLPERDELRWRLRQRTDEVLEQYTVLHYGEARAAEIKAEKQYATDASQGAQVVHRAEAKGARVGRRLRRNPSRPLTTAQRPSIKEQLCMAFIKLLGGAPPSVHASTSVGTTPVEHTGFDGGISDWDIV
ncbi:hypothetical protein LTR85_008256 [Meristemomyces frigidus]|nr:hypothetical protein LTR85_008256 [Meristemomyces frigidus]